jgi:hypothetical protein
MMFNRTVLHQVAIRREWKQQADAKAAEKLQQKQRTLQGRTDDLSDTDSRLGTADLWNSMMNKHATTMQQQQQQQQQQQRSMRSEHSGSVSSTVQRDTLRNIMRARGTAVDDNGYQRSYQSASTASQQRQQQQQQQQQTRTAAVTRKLLQQHEFKQAVRADSRHAWQPSTVAASSVHSSAYTRRSSAQVQAVGRSEIGQRIQQLERKLHGMTTVGCAADMKLAAAAVGKPLRV